MDNKDAVNQAYWERNQLVAYLSKLFPAHFFMHYGEDWSDEWRTGVCVHLPTGQATWHIHKDELTYFDHLSAHDMYNHWDGHTTEEKYKRMQELKGIYRYD